jgi:CHAD domain-containing protein
VYKRQLLRRAFFRVRFLGLNDPDVHLLLKQLEQSHLAAAKAYIRCRNSPKPQLIHEFRKKSKTLLYQLCFFRRLNQRAVRSLEKRLDIMTQNLGKYNDLVQIMNILGYKYGNPGNSPVTDELALVIRDRQDSHLIKVWPAAYRIFAPGKSLKDILGLSF